MHIMLRSLVGGFGLMKIADSTENVKRMEYGRLSTILEREGERRIEAGSNGNHIMGIAMIILLFVTVHTCRYVR